MYESNDRQQTAQPPPRSPGKRPFPRPRSQWPHRSTPAWALSGVLHLVAVCVFALCVRAVSEPVTEPDRSVAIVMANRTSDQVEYFSEEEDFREEQPSASFPAAADAPIDLEMPDPTTDFGLPPVAGAAPEAVDSIGLPALGGRGRVEILPGLGDEEILAADTAGKRDAAPTGTKTQVSIFGSATATGRSFVFVIDCSKSMGSGGLAVLGAAEKELTAALSRLTTEQQFQVLAYNRRAWAFHGRKLLPASDANKRLAIQFVKDLVAFGPTEHYVAVSMALRMSPEVVFLLTDGGAPALEEFHLQRLARANQGAAIFTLQFGDGPRGELDSSLKKLADMTGGSYRYVDVRQLP